MDFINFRQKCIFCNKPLQLILAQLILNDSNPISNHLSKNNDYVFSIEDDLGDVESIVYMDLNKNIVNLKLSESFEKEVPELDSYDYLMLFMEDPPYLELKCTNTACKKEYGITSEVLNFTRIPKVFGTLSFDPIELSFESFKINNYVVMADWQDNVTKIYHVDNADSMPIKTTFIDFSLIKKDTISNKIRTLVTFS